MPDQRVTTIIGSNLARSLLAESAIRDFRASLRGRLLRSGDAGYEDARKIWNGMIDRRPALIACCAGVADVINSVKFARKHDLLVAVRGGGHNIAGNAVCDDGLMINLSGMKGIRVDPATRTARAEAGLTWAEFDCDTQAFGLATTGGQISTTGIAGLTLGGGWGYLARQHGLTSDNLISVDIVTADGQLLTVSENQHPDLFWGLRGGGGNFGIVTSFELMIRPPPCLRMCGATPRVKRTALMRLTSRQYCHSSSVVSRAWLNHASPAASRAAIFSCGRRRELGARRPRDRSCRKFRIAFGALTLNFAMSLRANGRRGQDKPAIHR